MMKRLQAVLLSALIGGGAAIIFYYFELVVRRSQDFVWQQLFNSDEVRLLVFPICITLTLVYFGAQALFDPKSSKLINQVATFPEATLRNFFVVLILGFFSLFAGASLGPEAILIPACYLFAAIVARSIFKIKKPSKLFGSLGLVGLFAAFFNSFVVGMLAIFLVKKELKFSPNRQFVLLSVITSASTVWILSFLNSNSYVETPAISWDFKISELGLLIFLLLAGYLSTYLLGAVNFISAKAIGYFAEKSWIIHGLAAGVVLATLYYLFGSLIQFTGNESIVPMIKESTELGTLGLFGILIGKICAIAWSKAAGYRGGLIFPSFFVASVLSAIVVLEMGNVNYVYGIIFALAGMLIADKKVKVLL